jgi:hypothetical protein
MNTEQANSVARITPDDHDAGFKDVLVKMRSGKEETVRLVALDARSVCRILSDEKGDQFWRILEASLPTDLDPSFHRRITTGSHNTLIAVAWALAVGTEGQKKMVEAVELLIKATETKSDAPN